MAVFNLGTMPQPRESELADLSKFTGELRKEQLVVAEKQKDREASYKSTLLKSKLSQNTQTRKFMHDAYQNYWNLPDDKRQMFDESDRGKQFQKRLKSELPEVFDENGELIPLPKSEIPAWTKDPRQWVKVRAELTAAQAKIKAKQPLNVGEATALLQVMSLAAMSPEQFGMTMDQVQANIQFANQALQALGKRGEDSMPSDLTGALNEFFPE